MRNSGISSEEEHMSHPVLSMVPVCFKPDNVSIASRRYGTCFGMFKNASVGTVQGFIIHDISHAISISGAILCVVLACKWFS
jgi:hypothetical protein